ncbi:unnamed protein product, partial [Porites evermanni]
MSSLMNILITFPSHPLRIRGIPSPATETNPEPTQKVQNVDSTRFPEISSEEIEELKAVVINRNTSNTTEQWINIFKSWCQSWHPENVNIETMAPEELDNILSKFYAKVKKSKLDLEVARSTEAYVEDFIIRQQEEGKEVVQFQEGPTKTRSGGLTILRRPTLQAMYSTNGGKTDQVHLFKLWLSKRPDG